jgi:predicted Zn-dependent protease
MMRTRSLAAEAAPMSRDALEALATRAIKLSHADGAQVDVRSGVSGNTRFAVNELSTAGDVSDATISVTSAFGPKRASVSTNDLSDEGVRTVVSQSEQLAKLAPDDPEAMPAFGPQQYQTIEAYFESTARVSAKERAEAALTALEPARAARGIGLMAAGFVVTGESASVTANKAGLSAFFRSTSANYTLTVRTADGTGSGWAAADDHDWTKLDPKAVAERAIEKAQRSRNPIRLEPGRYTVILEPQAVGDLVQLVQGELDARSADEGRSAFVRASGGSKVGETIADSRVTLFSDPADPQLRSAPYDGEGFPVGRQVWIENGVLRELSYSRFWAKKQGKEYKGQSGSLKLIGGPTSRQEMIKSTERGVLVTRLWYLREVDPRTILYTGLTRDGTFLIEHGEITKSIRNFRFNDSPLFLLNNLDALGPVERLAGTEGSGDVAMPILKARDFDFTSLSDAV